MKAYLIFVLFIVTANILKSQIIINNQELLKELNAKNFELSKNHRAMPKYISTFLDSVCGGKFRFSKKKQISFTYGFDINKRVLEFIGTSLNYYIVCYEHTGRGDHYHVLVFKVYNKKVIFFYNLVGPAFHSIDELKKYLDLNLFKNQKNYDI